MLKAQLRPRARRATVLLCALLLSGCAAEFPPHPTLESYGLRNFAKVTDDVYRSGQPNAEQLDHLVKEYGIKSIIRLSTGNEPANSLIVDSPRISPWSVVSKRAAPTTEQIVKILDAIDCAPKPVLIHCLHGEDRTGLIVGLWRIRHGTSVADAYADMMRRGFHANYGGVWKAWVRETGGHKPGTDVAPVRVLASKPNCGPETLAPEPQPARQAQSAISDTAPARKSAAATTVAAAGAASR